MPFHNNIDAQHIPDPFWRDSINEYDDNRSSKSLSLNGNNHYHCNNYTRKHPCLQGIDIMINAGDLIRLKLYIRFRNSRSKKLIKFLILKEITN